MCVYIYSIYFRNYLIVKLICTEIGRVPLESLPRLRPYKRKVEGYASPKSDFNRSVLSTGRPRRTLPLACYPTLLSERALPQHTRVKNKSQDSLPATTA